MVILPERALERDIARVRDATHGAKKKAPRERG
jgi:hypothetical protein